MGKERKRKNVLEGLAIDSILDLNATNIWKLEAEELKLAWEHEEDTTSFMLSEDKLLNIIRLAYEVAHYNPKVTRESLYYENGEWTTFQHCDESKGWIAIQKRHITKLSDLTYENIHHITAATLLELIDRNFGGGWDSISLAVKDIIISRFDISTTTLPATRLHMVGGTLDKKLAQGFEVLEIERGTWIEAIFAKKKGAMAKVRMNEDKYDEDGNLRKTPLRNTDEDTDDEELPEDSDVIDEDVDDNNVMSDEQMDDTFYSSFSEEAKPSDEDEDLASLSMDGED